MTVKDIFELRKRGQVEAAYEAIRPIYAAHKGRYTTLCMFWVASDVFKLRVEQGRIEEAEKIYWALKRLVPLLEEYDRQGTSEREATLRPFDRLRDRKAQGPPLTVWLIKKADIVRKRDFHKDKSLFLCQCQLLVVSLHLIIEWRVVVLSSELLDSVLERPTSSTLLLYTFVIPA